MLTYRTNALGEKPVSQFSSTTSLGPLQASASMAGPGQKFNQAQPIAQYKKSKSIVSSTDNLSILTGGKPQLSQTQRASGLSATLAQIAPKTTTAAGAPTVGSAKETPVIKLSKVEEIEGAANDLPATSAFEETKTAGTISKSSDETGLKSSRSAQPEIAEKEPVAEVFKQRIVQYRRTISKSMVFSDQLEMRDPQMVAELATDIYQNMRKLESNLKVDADYLSKV